MKLSTKLVTVLGGGGFRLPFTEEFGGSGALPSPWVGATFSQSGGLLSNTPAVGSNLLTDPGLEATYTAGLCDTLTKAGSPTLAESADVHGGSKAQSFTAVAFNNSVRWAAAAGIAGAWYRFSVWAKRSVGSTATAYLELYQTGLLPGEIISTPLTDAAYTQKQLSAISTSTNLLFRYPVHDYGSADWPTIIADDGVFERLTYSTLFAMLPSAARSATVKVQPDTLVDGTLSGIVAWANADASPTTYLLACFRKADTFFQYSLIKVVAGVYTTLIADASVNVAADAWFEIRPVDNDTVGLYYNNVQLGSNQDVTDVPGDHPGLVITGGNKLKGFFAG